MATYVGIEGGIVACWKASLLLHISDYLHLLDERVIRKDGSIDTTRFGRRHEHKRGYYAPIGYRTPAQVRELMEFMMGEGLDLICDLLGKHPCRIRQRIGIVPSDRPPLTVAEFEAIRRMAETPRKYHTNLD
jgi:hypothetical protein